MLLAMFQKMRLIREKNQLVLEQSQFSSKLSRIEKNIERTQKRYTSLFAQIDSQAKMMQSQATVMFQGMFNLGAGSVNPYNYSGLNQFQLSYMNELNKAGKIQIGVTQDSDGKNIPDYYAGSLDLEAMATEYGTNMGFEKNEDGTWKNWDEDAIKAFNSARQAAATQQQYAQYQSQQMSQQYANNVSIWTEAQKAQLEAEQDAALEPLNYEQTMLELEKEQKDMRLKRIEAELQRYNELCSKEAENAAPSFGLG